MDTVSSFIAWTTGGERRARHSWSGARPDLRSVQGTARRSGLAGPGSQLEGQVAKESTSLWHAANARTSLGRLVAPRRGESETS